jgi:hypothetical protein
MEAGKQTVFLLPETSGDLWKRANLESTHLGLSTLALFHRARAGGALAAGCMGGGQGVSNSGEILGAVNPNPDHRSTAVAEENVMVMRARPSLSCTCARHRGAAAPHDAVIVLFVCACQCAACLIAPRRKRCPKSLINGPASVSYAEPVVRNTIQILKIVWWYSGTADRPRFAAVGCVGFLVRFRARARNFP